MAVYCVTYDLNSPGQDYDSINKYLKQFQHCKHLDTFWLIDTQQNSTQIRDSLKSLVDKNDVVLVARLRQGWASFNFKCSEWLKDPSRTW